MAVMSVTVAQVLPSSEECLWAVLLGSCHGTNQHVFAESLEACVGRACAVPRGLTKLTCCKKTIFPLDRNLEECFCSRDGVSGTSSSLVCRRLLLHFFL